MSTSAPGPRDSWTVLGPALADVFDAALTPFGLLSTDLRYVAVNRAYCEVSGREPADMLGRAIFDVFPEPATDPDVGGDADAPGLRRSLELALSTCRTHTMPLLRFDVAAVEGPDPVERYWHVSNVPIPGPDGRPWLVLNHPEEITDFIDERLRLEAVGAQVSVDTDGQSSSQLQAVDSAFTAAISRLQNLNDLASQLVGATDTDAIGRALLTDGLAMAGASGGSFVILENDRLTIMDHLGIDQSTTDRWTTFTVNEGVEPFSDALIDGRPRFFSSPEEFLAVYPGLGDEITRNDHQSWAVLPLRVADHVTGAIGLVYAEHTPFADPLRLVLFTLANLVAQATARAELIREQSMAMESVQATVRPSLDAIGGVAISDLYRPASAVTNAGGDWYDVIAVSDRCTLIAIGDVANHGPVAIGEMARTRATVHALALQGLAPDEIATQADLVLSRVAATFTTGIIAVFDSVTNMLTWTTAGHPHPLLRSHDGSTRFLEPTHGPPLGAGVEAAYESSALVVEPGDTLVLFTDGLVERSDEPIDEGFERLRRVVGHTAVTARFAEDVFEQMVDADRQVDDVAVLTFQVCAHPADAPAPRDPA